MKVAWKTDAGKVRENNEDNFIADEESGIFLIADGMGGHNAGEVASDLAIREAYAFLKNHLSLSYIPMGKDEDEEERRIHRILLDALLHAHRVILETAKEDLSLMGMGTTLVELIVQKDKAFLCNAGDSRAYRFRKKLQQITKDHTVGDYLMENHSIPREHIPARQWHTLTQAVGTQEEPVPDFHALDLQSGDILLLCTDGLTDMLPDNNIEAIVQQHLNEPDKMADDLIKAANSEGGKDNISLIVVHYAL